MKAVLLPPKKAEFQPRIIQITLESPEDLQEMYTTTNYIIKYYNRAGGSCVIRLAGLIRNCLATLKDFR